MEAPFRNAILLPLVLVGATVFIPCFGNKPMERTPNQYMYWLEEIPSMDNENTLESQVRLVLLLEVERELGSFSQREGVLEVGTKSKYSGSKFNMLVEDIREGILVFEDEDDAVKYCDLLQGGGQGCFNICHKMKLSLSFRRGRTPPLPQSLDARLKGKKEIIGRLEFLGYIV
ncbi:hypothetical protein GUJ93_ZPchr0013g36330 [Zizania palustris]|uniref:Uncharacterized protein n=1 Tax=Zizania palustris TaxID=103762 RepID=A0A8J6BVY5_ZIZPA|nr:hypothetical protein GUJ93_ZPchr0013g36330 [Zizania palustris]